MSHLRLVETPPPPTPHKVRRWDMNDWREGAWVVIVVFGFGSAAALWFVLDKLLWFLVPVLPGWREISQSYGHTDDLGSEDIRALFAGIFCVGAILFGWLNFWLVASIMLAIVVLLSLWQHYETRRCAQDDLDPNKNPT